MNNPIESSIIERLHRLDESRQAEVLDFIEFLAARSIAASSAANWPEIDPSRDLAKFIGVATFSEDGVVYQRRIRDTEWP
ncbi:MAG: hypothetical protein HY016_06930 [Nitrosomonadales bacterium]|nr:hypothetical protein [Nitrosomonadales bacterium]